jgi:hypothetical protein
MENTALRFSGRINGWSLLEASSIFGIPFVISWQRYGQSWLRKHVEKHITDPKKQIDFWRMCGLEVELVTIKK